jgi:hypothetical protein
LGREGYGNVRPFGLGNGTFDDYMIYFSVIVSSLSLDVKIGIRDSSDCKDCAIGWESFILLLGLLDLWRRWRWRRLVGFSFNLGVAVVLRWVSDLWNCWRVCYL